MRETYRVQWLYTVQSVISQHKVSPPENSKICWKRKNEMLLYVKCREEREENASKFEATQNTPFKNLL